MVMMTDNEIIKALECCSDWENGDTCKECPFYEELDCATTDRLDKYALNLITRQKAEIERLQAECGNQSTLWRNHFESIFESAKETIKEEAIKECLQEVVKRTKSYSCACRIRRVCDEIEKEMVGEDKVQWSKQGECPITPEQFNAIYDDEEMVGDV